MFDVKFCYCDYYCVQLYCPCAMYQATSDFVLCVLLQAAYGASESSVSLTINGVSYIIDFATRNQVSHLVQNYPRRTCMSEFSYTILIDP